MAYARMHYGSAPPVELDLDVFPEFMKQVSAAGRAMLATTLPVPTASGANFLILVSASTPVMFEFAGDEDEEPLPLAGDIVGA